MLHDLLDVMLLCDINVDIYGLTALHSEGGRANMLHTLFLFEK